MAGGLRGLGFEVEERPDGMVIQGGRPRWPTTVDATGDHRIAMSFAVASLAGADVGILGAEAVRSSWPSFFDDLEALRA
jgi:3-phosphoshikimate 1-carboxyvinyltransferase